MGGQTLDAWYGLNSLHNHDAGAGNANTSTGNWIYRMALQAPNGGNTYTLGGQFGFANAWMTPPQTNGQEEVPSPYITGAGSWTNAGNVEVVGFVPDNFEGPRLDPAVANGLGFAYESRLLTLIDAWQTNAPNPNRRYVVYAGWPDMGGYGDPATMDATAIANYQAYALGAYQTWMELLVSRLKTARPQLDIRLHNVNKATMLAWRDTAVRGIPARNLFEDDAPHGRSSWYFLAAVAEYIELFNEKPPTNFSFNPAWDVDPIIVSNYQAIVDFIWNAV